MIKASFLFLFFIYSFEICSFYAQDIPEEQVVTSAVISVAGDLMCHSVQYKYAHVQTDSFNFNPVFREIKKYIEPADFAIANLETVLAGKEKGYSGYPFFNSPDDFLAGIKNAGFNLIVTSNNHSLDRGEYGVKRTLRKIKELGLNYAGTFNSQEDHDSIRIFNINGIKIAVLPYTYGTNGIPVPKGKSYLINIINPDQIKTDIQSARKSGADIVLVHFHYGIEYKREPVDVQKDIVNKTIEYGADIIIGGHPHVVQPVDFFPTNNATLDTGFVAYSMGNFVSNQRWRYSDAGVIVNFRITKNLTADSVYLSYVNYIPTWVYKGETPEGSEYIILPSHNFNAEKYSYLSSGDLNTMKEAYFDTKNIINKYSQSVKLKELK